MFLALFGCSAALLAAFLGMLRLPPKAIRVCAGVTAILCFVFLLLALIIENPFTGKPIAKEALPSDNTGLQENIDNISKILSEMGTEELHMVTHSWKMDFYAWK